MHGFPVRQEISSLTDYADLSAGSYFDDEPGA